uniref:Uncharacterized protein n=2 Tax=Brassica oleracea TaxID=3712 RepID=A0A0D3CGY7_BRAOL|nr:unnamed protein product [Brassica oleracea]
MHSRRIEKSIQDKIWLFWFQIKRISMPWIVKTKHVISLEVFGTDCDVTDGSHPMIFLETKGDYSQKLRATRKILQDQEQSGGKLANQLVLRIR